MSSRVTSTANAARASRRGTFPPFSTYRSSRSDSRDCGPPGSEPSSETARRRIGTAASESVRAGREWARTNRWPADLTVFEREILPGLACVPARAIAEATGLSIGYCRRIVAGLASPHPMWWEAMRAVSGMGR